MRDIHVWKEEVYKLVPCGVARRVIKSHTDTELIPLVPNSLKREIWKEEVHKLLKQPQVIADGGKATPVGISHN